MAQIVKSDNSKLSSAKQPSTICSIGDNDRLRSSIEQFNRSFVAKRVLKTSFLLSGESKRDYRKVFANCLRHTYHNPKVDGRDWPTNPNNDILCPRRLQNKNHYIEYNGINVSTDEIKLDDSEDQVREFKSPYSLQFMEDLSWNLNRRKCLPYGLVVSQQNHFTLNTPQSYDVSLMGYAQQDNSALALPIYGDLNDKFGNGFAKVRKISNGATNIQVESDKLVSEPLLTDVSHDFTAGQSQMRKLLSYLNDRHFKEYTADVANPSVNAKWQPKHAVGKYHAQIQSGAAYYTFVNTGDSDMIVDMVVHKIKDGMAVTEHTEMDNLTMKILLHYGENWMDKRIRAANNDLYNDTISMGSYRPDDVYINPKVKFLPSSLRLNHRNTVKATPAGRDVLVKYRHADELGNADIPDPAQQELAAKEGFNPEGKWGQEFGYRLEDLSSPPFVDVYREQIIVKAGKRKTLTLRLPSKSYDPTQAVYSTTAYEDGLSGVMNEHGYHVTFGVTGKKARTIVEPEAEVGVNPEVIKMGSKMIGVHHAATSFKVIGRYYESIIPAVCVAPDNYSEQSLDLEPDVAQYMNEPRMYSALFNDVTSRDVDGRYIRLGTDGTSTKAQQTRLIAKFNEWHDNSMRASRAEDQIDEDELMDQDLGDGQTARVKIKQEVDATAGMTPERAPKEKKAKSDQMAKGFDKLRRKLAKFTSSIPDKIEEAAKWRDGHPHTVKLVKDTIVFLGTLWTGTDAQKAIAAEAAIHSGVSKEEIYAAQAEVVGSSSIGYDMLDVTNTAYDNVNLFTVDYKRRKLMATDDIVVVDNDPNADGIQTEAQVTVMNPTHNVTLTPHMAGAMPFHSGGLTYNNLTSVMKEMIEHTLAQAIEESMNNPVVGGSSTWYDSDGVLKAFICVDGTAYNLNLSTYTLTFPFAQGFTGTVFGSGATLKQGEDYLLS